MLGFDLINNFKQPYFSVSITDFWRRWHISLSRWLKDYVYIPLGGSRCSKFNCCRNILITFLVSGIWHGANWTFIVWGLGHGVFQVVEKVAGEAKCSNKLLYDLPHMVFTFFVVNILWILFRVSNISGFGGFLHRIITQPFEGEILNDFFVFNILLIIVVFVKDAIVEKGLISKVLYKHTLFRWAIYISVFAAIILYGVLDSNQFIYVSF